MANFKTSAMPLNAELGKDALLVSHEPAPAGSSPRLQVAVRSGLNRTPYFLGICFCRVKCSLTLADGVIVHLACCKGRDTSDGPTALVGQLWQLCDQMLLTLRWVTGLFEAGRRTIGCDHEIDAH